MAAALVCEICGGKLIGKPGGIFECDSCGIEYSTEWAKAKIQEIKGTVKVEGTVEVQGTVKVEGAVNAKSLLRRGQMALEDGNCDEAKDYFNQVLDIDPECAAAYWGLALVDAGGAFEELVNICLKQEPKNIERAREFADSETCKELDKLDTAITECRLEAEAKRRQEHIAKLNRIKVGMETELSNLKGLFTGMRRNALETRLKEIINELQKLGAES